MTHILGIESSCDETAAAVVEDGRNVLSNIIASQHDLHRRYHGVVPEIASRAHVQRINPVIEQALDAANTGWDQIVAVAVGNRPGLIGSLLVGICATKTIAWSLGKPLIGINHLWAHLHAAVMGHAPTTSHNPPSNEHLYPALGLVVSGGHTSLFEVPHPWQFNLMGRTIDDAAGEAFDKAAVILNLGYPGGPAIAKTADRGDPAAYALPRSTLGPDSLDFSFSGLKTALLYKVRGHPVRRGPLVHYPRSAEDLTDTQRTDLAASFQSAVVETLILKLRRAIDAASAAGRPPQCLLVGGGVVANTLLRHRLSQLGEECSLPVRFPPLALCTDNAAMIAGLAYESYKQQRFDNLDLPVLATTAQ